MFGIFRKNNQVKESKGNAFNAIFHKDIKPGNIVPVEDKLSVRQAAYAEMMKYYRAGGKM